MSSVKVDRVISPKYHRLDKAMWWLGKPPPHPTRKTAHYSFIIRLPKNDRCSINRLRSPIWPFLINFFVNVYKPLRHLQTLKLPIDLNFIPEEVAKTPIKLSVRNIDLQPSAVAKNTNLKLFHPNSRYLKRNYQTPFQFENVQSLKCFNWVKLIEITLKLKSVPDLNTQNPSESFQITFKPLI